MMQQPEMYYYGQGRVFIALRNEKGQALAQRWVGDVSNLSLALTTENIEHRESYSGEKAVVRRIASSKSGEISATWHDLSPLNLAMLFAGHVVDEQSGSITGEMLPAGIKAGERYSLAHPSVSDVVINAGETPLVLDTDYIVDETFGAIEFLTDQTTAPEVAYKYEGNVTATLFTEQGKEVALRYEGINLAEGGTPIIVEFYKVKFDPVSGLSLINNDNSLAGLETKAGLLMDTKRSKDDKLGRFGRLTNVKER
ncbi:hypothetical protein [Providencia rettgeri]|uniref:phage tail tube protein n=1 Tax=Providencia rettgeri TaxID=587 RepID=UPI001F03A4D7|nr:hypothetical protein [Providencia rettgeri]